MIITYDSKRAVTVSKESDQVSYINMFSLNTQQLLFTERISGTYIKVKEVEQNSFGNGFAVVYSDNGKFRLRTFSTYERSDEEIQDNELKINEMFGINDYTMTNDDFPDPFINCCFINVNRVFVNFFHSH